MSDTIRELFDMVQDINCEEIKSHDTDEALYNWTFAWRNRMFDLICNCREHKVGKWLEYYTGAMERPFFRCSECRYIDSVKMPFCGNCGAVMTGKLLEDKKEGEAE